MAALAAAPDPILLLEEARVADAAAAVAQARRDGARSSRVAELMTLYRAEAERLAAMQPAEGPVPTPDLAVVRLSEATAVGAEDAPARAELEVWLGPLEPRLELLSEALTAAATSPPELVESIAVDVEAQAVAVIAAATYDAMRAEVDARQGRTRIAALRAATSPLEQGGLATEVELRRLTDAVATAVARATELRALAARASLLRDAARHLREP